MKVKANATGFYGGARRRAGEVFEVKDGASASWFDKFVQQAPAKAPAVKDSKKSGKKDDKKEPDTFSEMTEIIAEQEKVDGAQNQEVI